MNEPEPWQPSLEYQAVLNQIIRFRLVELDHEMRADLLELLSVKFAERSRQAE